MKQTVKSYLGQAYLLDQRIKSDTMELEELRLMSQTISSPGFEEHYNATKNTDAPYVKTIEKIMEYEDLLMKEIAMLVALKNQIWEVISKVEKPEFRTVLQYRYIHNCTWPHIADIVKADESTVRRWHNKAIANVTLPDDAIDLKFKKD
ncbi:MAG: DUF1492 domain-containing protein [Suilimivivens sp.]